MTALFPRIDSTVRLDADGLSQSRGGVTLFDGLTCSIRSGDVLWIKGSNGIGKTTLLEVLAGLSRPDTGSVTWQRDDTHLAADKLIAYQPHLSFAKASLTATEDLYFWARIYQTGDRVAATLETVRLSSRANVPSQNLSAGQRKRLALAKLLLSGKPIWIMDEPDAAMDEDGIALIDSLIGQHVERGGSVIIASHAMPRKISTQTRKLTLNTAS